MQKRRYSIVLVIAGLVSVTVVNSAEDRAQRSPSSSQPDCCAVLELRQYTLKPGQRDVLIDVFDRHFVESQEALGMTIVGQFRDRRRADRFVWIRGFSDMQTRHTALERFYGGPVWAEHKAAANATMLDVNDVLLLKPAQPNKTFRLDISSRPTVGEERGHAIVLVGIHRLRQAADDSIVTRFQQQVVPALRRDGVGVESIFVTEPAPNTFKGLPVREGEHNLVWFGTLQNGNTPTAERLREVSAPLSAHAEEPAELLALDPTPRSLFGRHAAPR